MANQNYRDVASEIVERYLVTDESGEFYSCNGDYIDGYRDALRMVLNVLYEKETTEAKNFYKFSKVFEENC